MQVKIVTLFLFCMYADLISKDADMICRIIQARRITNEGKLIKAVFQTEHSIGKLLLFIRICGMVFSSLRINVFLPTDSCFPECGIIN